jgi:hypothetical protein
MENDLSSFLKFSSLTALLLNFVGALFLILSSDIFPGGWTNVDDNGMPLDALYLLYPTIFKIGVWFIIIGFLIQVFNEFLKFEPIKNTIVNIWQKKSFQNTENKRK